MGCGSSKETSNSEQSAKPRARITGETRALGGAESSNPEDARFAAAQAAEARAKNAKKGTTDAKALKQLSEQSRLARQADDNREIQRWD